VPAPTRMRVFTCVVRCVRARVRVRIVAISNFFFFVLFVPICLRISPHRGFARPDCDLIMFD
jgi:hypothetical protein